MMSRTLVTLCPRNVTNVTLVTVCGCCHWSLAGRRLRPRREASAGSRARTPATRGYGAAKIQGGAMQGGSDDTGPGARLLVTT